jgi:rod shape-determining protein MreD
VSHRNTIALCLAAYLVVFLETHWQGGNRLFLTKIDLLPSLLVCGGIISTLGGVTIASIFAGLAYDSFSVNPLGISVLPLFVCAAILHRNREYILQAEYFAQFVLGTLASLAVPVTTALMLLGMGQQPIIGWESSFSLVLAALIGGACTPVWFFLFQKWNDALHYPLMSESSFNPDRQIDRGRF